MDAGLPVMFLKLGGPWRDSLGSLFFVTQERHRRKDMDPRDAYSHRERYQFIDVRQTYEFEAGHVEWAVHMTLQEVPARYEELDRRRPVVVTCQVGQRSALAAEFLTGKGFTAHNLDGGLEAWIEVGLPLVASEGASGNVVDGHAETPDWGGR
jgi:rhodanese-related sulfurtransferase